MEELRSLNFTRSNNNPVADYAEWIAAKGLDLSLCRKSTKGYDATDAKGQKYEIKARRITNRNKSRRLSQIRNLDSKQFDWLIAILFDEDFSVLKAAQIPHSVVKEQCGFSEHTNSSIFHLRDRVWDIQGVRDITQAIKLATEPDNEDHRPD